MSARRRARAMNRRQFLSRSAAGTGALALGLHDPSSAGAAQVDRPNFLWLVSEDNSPYLGAYGDPQSATPTLDRLAAEGIRYENAFATAPVCAPTRFGIVTGLEATTCGPAHQMRASGHIPNWLRGFPAYLREAGYHCTNNAKTDYNAPISIADAWDASSGQAHWRNRPAAAPFFAVFNYNVTHESQLFPGAREPLPTGPGPDEVRLPPYHPDASQLRADRSLHYDLMTSLDQQVAQRLAELEADGLAGDTIVVYYGDHGGVLPRSKRSCLDSGLRIPLVVRFPARWAHLAPAGPGTVTDEIVDQLDLAPTMLSLAGLPVPDYMSGRVFAGDGREPPKRYTFGFRNRMDERYDMSRTVRDARYRYTRNYLPHVPYGQHNEYAWQQLGMAEWERLFHEGRCDDVQSAYWRDKPVEELYDLWADPHEVTNLAADPARRTVRNDLRAALDAHLVAVNDNGFIPEGSPLEGFDASRSPGAYPLAEVMRVAAVAAERRVAGTAQLIRWLLHDNECVRYWAALGCVMLRGGAKAATGTLLSRLNDPSWSVRIVAAQALCWLRERERGLAVLTEALLHHDHERIRLQAANALDEIGSLALATLPALRQAGGDANLQVRQAVGYTAAVLAGEWPYADGLSLQLPATWLVAGEPGRVTVRLHNSGEQARVNIQLSLAAPDGWVATPATPAGYAALPAGHTVEAGFDLTAPPGTEPGEHFIHGVTTYSTAGHDMSTRVRRPIYVEGEPA
ncbi:sulfatase-like hydrolase/transferase [Jiangella asiatica]|uniref:sulfatase-like hydrolase/transferase n=1 Tax=Jiangella asiatica TaxID=2530372 RepID=UPI00193E5EEE|nr:sulfatase-like hydrolase/transferase [Jiangella asiatica]